MDRVRIQEIEMDVWRDKRLRYTVTDLFVPSDLPVVAKQRGSNTVQPATVQ